MARGQLRIRILGDDRHLRRKLKGATKLLGGFAAAGAAAVAGLAAFSIREFANFDDAMTKSLAIMGDVSDKMRGEMADAAREVGRTTKFSAEEAAESYFFLASAGMDAATSIEALPRVARFAQAGNFDMARATDLATDAQSALGMAADDTAEHLEQLNRVQDVFVKANTLANATVEEFADSITSKGGAALRALNKDVEEGVAVLAVFADQGLKGSEAGTILARTLDGLADRARVSADQFADLGVAVFDGDGEMRNMAAIIEDLEGALDGMSTEQRAAELAQLGFNERTRRGIETLLGNSEALREYERELRNAAGTTDEVADTQMESFNAKMGLIWDQIKDVALSIGQALMPALEAFADWLQASLPGIVNWFDGVAGKFTELVTASEESVGGVTGELGVLDRRVEQSRKDNIREFNELTTQQRHLLGVAHTDIQGYRRDVDDEFTTIGGFMGRLWEAWKVVWDDDIKPWLLNTVVPWVEEEFAPALGRALWSAGKSAGGRLLDGLADQIKGLPGRIGDTLDASIQGELDTRGPLMPKLSPGPDASKAIEGFSRIPEFHSGGVLGGRSGQESLFLGMAGETVLPTHDAAAMGRLLAAADREAGVRLSSLQPSGGRTERLLEELVEATRASGRGPKSLSISVGSREDLPRARQTLRKITAELNHG